MGEQSLLRDRYEVLDVRGRGGQGEVLRAVDRRHDRLVALKVRTFDSPDQLDRLAAETRLLLDVRPHPGMAVVRDDFVEGERYLIVMDWVEGTDLDSVVRDRGGPGLRPSAALAYLTQVADTLDHLHRHLPPIVHADVKPANLILTRDGVVVLVDFGLASFGVPRDPGAGTVGYVAPETAAGLPPTPRTDVFGLAATAVTLLTGSPPDGELPSWAGIDPGVAGAVGRAIRRGLSIDPQRRPATAGELVERMRRSRGTAVPPGGVVTFLLSGIVGSTSTPQVSEADRRLAMARYDALVVDAVEEHGGQLISVGGHGDNAASVFARATDAVAAAYAVQQAVRLEVWPGDRPPAVRLGLHTGEAPPGDYTGPAMRRADGIRALATSEQILLSKAAAEIVAGALPAGTRLDDLGEHSLPGVSSSEHVYALASTSEPQPRHADASRPDPSTPSGLGDEGSAFMVRTQRLYAEQLLSRQQPGDLVLASTLVEAALEDARAAELVDEVGRLERLWARVRHEPG